MLPRLLRNLLAPRPHAAATQVLAEERAKRAHLVVAFGGPHAFGFGAEGSAVALRGVHVAPTVRWLGLAPPPDDVWRADRVSGVEIDYASVEARAMVLGVLAGNGDYVERVLAPSPPVTSAEHAALVPLVRGALSRRLYPFFRGAVGARVAEVSTPSGCQAGHVLGALRTALTGAHLLKRGEAVTDLTALMEEYDFGSGLELVEAHRAAPHALLPEALRAHWLGELDRARALVDEAHARTSLPPEPPNIGELEAWLVELRRARL